VLLGQTLLQERIANEPRKGDVNDPAGMHMADFCIPNAEFSAAKTVGMD
jgi:hypothetical protein